MKYDQSFKKYEFVNLGKQRESFSPNTDNFLAFFIVFEWGRMLKSAMDKNEVKYDAKLHSSNYFSVNVFILAIVFRQQIKKTFRFQTKLSVFRNLSAKYNR